MPTDLLLPAFALTLAVNALFVAVAIRSLRGDHARRTPPAPPAPGRTIATAITPSGSVAPAPSAGPATDPERPATPEGKAPIPAQVQPKVPGPALDASTAVRSESAPSTAARPARSVPAAAAGQRPPTGRRRKFSLPPLDDDSGKVNRSIETFLAGTEAIPNGASTGEPPGPMAVPQPIVTVAAIQLLGDGPRDILERTIRGAARGSDQVSVDRRGRVRVVLSGTGELAAHAYLRRIRATVEPIIEAANPQARVVIATATELDGAVATARRRADRRLTTALRGAVGTVAGVEDLIEDDTPPRAAGD